MAKAIKEIILALLVCLVGILLFAVILYKFLPSRKVVAEVVTYSTSAEVKELLADTVDEEEDQVVLKYEVTNKDLSNYESSNDYVPGKVNPFAEVADDEEKTDDENNNNSNGNNSNSNNSTSNDNNSDSEYIRNPGTK